MFKLKRVELQGFKSFADRSRLDFGLGTAAIVGPNGCGKSNLSDAISWVLGEQSARMLRGERMADVIFNGTGNRPPTSMAEVSMTLARLQDTQEQPFRPNSSGAGDDGVWAAAGPNVHGKFPASSGDEVVVTRRLFRSGESEYLLNGQMCRLRDIQDLFMGTGLGPESYAIIEQGRIGQILSSKPSDRRAMIEEAAGISKFKSRKRLAEAKLESSRLNLARISDILEEVNKQVNSLKRQASKAERYHQLQGEYRARQRVVLASQLLQLQAGHEVLTAEHAALQQECAESARRMEEIEREGRDLTARHDDIEEQLKQAHQKLAQGELAMERLRSRIEQARRESTGIEKRIAETGIERERLRTHLGLLHQEIEEREKRVEELRRELNAAQEGVRTATGRQSETASALAATEKRVESLRQGVIAAVGRAAELRNQLVQAEESGFAIDRQLARARTEQETAEAERERMAIELGQFEQEHLSHSSAVTQLSQSAAESSGLLEEAKNGESDCRMRLESLREEYSKASARKQALEESLARHAYSTDSVRKLLSGGNGSNDNSFRPLGLLADFIEVTPGYEEVVEEFLRAELDSIVVEGHREARHGIALVENEGNSRTAFFIQKFPTNGTGKGKGPEEPPASLRPPGVKASLQEMVRFEPRLGLNGNIAFPVLASTYFVEAPEDAEKLAEAYPLCHFLTRSGEHYHHRIVAGGKRKSAGPLALRRDFRELERRTADLQGAMASADAEWNERKDRVQRHAEDLFRLNAARQEAEKQSLVTNEKLRQAKRAFEVIVSRIQILRQESSMLEAEKLRIGSRRAELELSMEQGGEARAQQERSLTEAVEAARELRVLLDRFGQELAAAQAGASGLREKMNGVETERARLASQAAETHEREARLVELADTLAAEAAQWKTEEQKAGELIADAASTLESVRQNSAGLGQQAAEMRARRDEINPLIDSRRAELEARRDRRSAAEVALARSEADLAHHLQRCRQELGLDPDALFAEVGPGQILQDENLSQAEQEVEEIKSRMERMGPVNMMALEELREAEERQVFLDTQRQDLLASINDTTLTIREIDEVSRRQFTEAFHAINGFFSESFRTLFGGGNGEMRLSDEADPECGIDIVAQPPGKRLQNVLLLSGGEKALTALALLIAIFRFTPSPFCVLDEVDAPLDDANVERFTRLIAHMSGHTQFILITHNKRTMEICRVLYGVTMQEPGVSRLVSVRLEQMETDPVALPA